MTPLERWATAALLIGMCSACAPPQSLVPLVPRPDTRRLTSFYMDSVLVRHAIEHFVAALPNEAALCLDGKLSPNPTAPVWLHVEITDFRAAAADSVDAFHVFLTREPRSGCSRGQLLAVAHDHTTVPLERPCTHSDPDALMLFADVRLLFSLVFCGEGRGEILFQDGRRGDFRWAPP